MAEGRKWIPGSAIASDALYSRICREWNSAQNGEIHEIAMKELQDMSAFIAESRFSNVPGMGTEDVASEAVLFMFRKGVQCYIENEALHSAPPALRLAYVRKQLTNAMISAIRTNRCRVSYIVKENSGKKRAYPDSLDYLKERYGLVYNEDLFFVSYDAFASNLMPDIQVTRKGAGA